MNKGQQAIAKKMHYLIEQVGAPFTMRDKIKLFQILQSRAIDVDHPWGAIIHRTITLGPCAEVDKLMADLSDQALDDPITMIKIVGETGTILLLRSLNQ